MDGYITIGTKLDDSMIDKQISLLEDKLEGLEEDYKALENAKPFEGQNKELIKLGNEINSTRKKLSKLVQEKEKMSRHDFSGIQNSIENIGNGIGKTVKKVAKWGLAIFSVRSAYMAVRQAMSTISQYDDKMAANVEYIRYALAMVLKPIIEWIINAVYKMLHYINYIANAWFGVNLFANASAKSFASANKNAKKLQKTMLSFDEANILSDNKDNGTATPSFDLSKMGNVEIPEWIKWIADNKDLIITIATIAAGIFGTKVVAGWISNLSGFMSSGKGLAGLGSTLGKLGIIAGSIAITALVAKKVWDEAAQLKKELQEIREAGAKGQEEWIKNEEDLNTLINTGNVNRTAGYELLKKSGGAWNWINGLGRENLETAKQTAVNIQKQIEKEIELYNQGKLNKDEQEKVKENIIEQVKYNSELIQKLKENGFETQSIEKLNEGLIQNYKDMGGSVEEVKTELGNVNKIKFDDKEIEVKVYASTTSFKEAMRRAIEYGQQLLGGLGFSAGGGGNIGGSGGGFRAMGGIYYPSKLPKLAVGGIINNPGPGVPYHGATIAEKGAEAVLPLTDSQQMTLLGEAIGRFITVNLTNVTELDGRQIARKVEQITNNNKFVLNR